LSSYKLWQDTVRRFPKDHRYTLGAKVTSLYIALLESIFLASTSNGQKKGQALETGVIKLDLLKFFLQVCWDSKALDTKKYSLLSEGTDKIGKMLGGWKKQAQGWLEKTNPAQ